jgi:hypothetical protein
MITTILIAIAAILLALLLAFVPLKLVVAFVGKNVVEPVRAFIERQRDRRTISRETPDRRHL